jgi:flagellar hook-length control protein FliK
LAAAPQDPSQPAALAAAPSIQPPTPAQAAAASATPETVARLATQIVQTAQGPASQFNLVLHPAELGGVQVKIQVDRNGQVRAALAFDNPQAAADLKAQADDLKAQLNQAGFDVADGGLSFSLNGQGGQAQGDNAAQQGLMGGRAFRSAAAGADDLLTQVNEAAIRLNRASAGGLDIRI